MTTLSIDPIESLSPEVVSFWKHTVAVCRLNPSLAPGWLRVSTQVLAPPKSQLRVLTARNEAGAVSCLVPHYTSDTRILGMPLKVLELGSNLMSYHAEVIPPDSSELALRALLESVEGWDLLRASNVVRESTTAKSIEQLSRELRAPLQSIPGDSSPVLCIQGTWDEYIEGRHKKFRYKWRKRQEDLARNKACEVRWYTTLQSAAELMESVMSIESRSWKAKQGLDVTSRNIEVDYYRLLLPYLANEGALLGIVLFHSGRPIAYSLCCNAYGWVGHMKTSFDEEFSELSPGALVIDASVKAAFDMRAREFDFLGDAAPHKLAWTSQVRDHASYFMFAPRVKTRLIGKAKQFREWIERARVRGT